MDTKYAKQTIDVEGWEREETFHFFKNFHQPFFNVHTEVEITPLYTYCKNRSLPFSLAYMYVTLQAARATDNFLLRLEDEKVVKYSGLDLSTTILRNDKNIAFTHLPYHNNLEDFCAEATSIIEQVKNGTKLFNGYQGPDLLHMTTLPWFKFKGMEHAYSISEQDPGVPKIGYGQLELQQDKAVLPISVGLHHALADGYHLHLFLQEMHTLINKYNQ